METKSIWRLWVFPSVVWTWWKSWMNVVSFILWSYLQNLKMPQKTAKNLRSFKHITSYVRERMDNQWQRKCVKFPRYILWDNPDSNLKESSKLSETRMILMGYWVTTYFSRLIIHLGVFSWKVNLEFCYFYHCTLDWYNIVKLGPIFQSFLFYDAQKWFRAY